MWCFVGGGSWVVALRPRGFFDILVSVRLGGSTGRVEDRPIVAVEVARVKVYDVLVIMLADEPRDVLNICVSH